jgi:hypothetical protein
MPLYEVSRTDDVQPGEFDNALVIAGGTSQARGAVAHLLKPGQKVDAVKLDVSGPRGGGGIRLLNTYFDERPAADAPEHIDDTLPLFDPRDIVL